MPALTRTKTRRQPIAAHEPLIGREPKALRVHQSRKIGPATYEIGPKRKNRLHPQSRFHTQTAPPNQISPYEILLIRRQTPLPNTC